MLFKIWMEGLGLKLIILQKYRQHLLIINVLKNTHRNI